MTYELRGPRRRIRHPFGDPMPSMDRDEWYLFQEEVNMEEQLNRATEEIERLQYENHQLQSEVSRLTIRREEGSGDIAHRLVCVASVEESKKRFAKTGADTITYTLKRDYTMTIGGTRYKVSIREVDA